jgi:hypothetical protein
MEDLYNVRKNTTKRNGTTMVFCLTAIPKLYSKYAPGTVIVNIENKLNQ